jgi:hypothetical protein
MSSVLLKQVRVLAPVVPERFAHHDGEAEPELVALLADAGDGDAVGPELGVDSRGHLRGFRLVGHGVRLGGNCTPGQGPGLLGTTHPSTLGPTHLPYLISANRNQDAGAAAISSTRKKET